MSTRGVYGFRRNGVDKITYNHSDSYPDGLGCDVVDFCRRHSVGEMNKMYDTIVLVKEDSKPTKEQIETCERYTNLGVSTQSPDDWYCLLRGAQGNLDAYANGLSYMIDSGDFILDSLFCEYGYIINLDKNVLEFWGGFQKKPDQDNRYGAKETDGYYPCKLLAQFSLNELDDDAVKTMCEIANMEADDE